MLSPELERLYVALTELKDHASTAGLFVEDDLGYRWAIEKAYAIGTRTDDPGLVIRIVRDAGRGTEVRCGATNHHPCVAQPPSMFGGQHACAENPHDGNGHQCSCGITFITPIHRVGDIETLLLAAVQHGGAIPGVPPIPSPARCACGRSATSLWSDGSVRCDDCPAE